MDDFTLDGCREEVLAPSPKGVGPLVTISTLHDG